MPSEPESARPGPLDIALFGESINFMRPGVVGLIVLGIVALTP